MNNKKEYCPKCREQKEFTNLRFEFAKNRNKLLKGNCSTCKRTRMLPVTEWDGLLVKANEWEGIINKGVRL